MLGDIAFLAGLSFYLGVGVVFSGLSNAALPPDRRFLGYARIIPALFWPFVAAVLLCMMVGKALVMGARTVELQSGVPTDTIRDLVELPADERPTPNTGVMQQQYMPPQPIVSLPLLGKRTHPVSTHSCRHHYEQLANATMFCSKCGDTWQKDDFVFLPPKDEVAL